MKQEVIKSPIFYMGNKERLIKKGLIDLFPKDIDNFYEIFADSAVCSLNVKCNNYYINDSNKQVIELIKYFKRNNSDDIIKHIESLIDYYEMPTFSTDARKYTGDREIYKVKFNRIRDDYNKTKRIDLLYLLNIFSNSHMIRFNSQGEFNMPFGNGYFTEDCKTNIKNNEYSKITYITNEDFRVYRTHKFEPNSFIYLDPPYYNTTATYNENGGWNKQDEFDLLKWCEELNENNIKFGLSNVFSCKDNTNTHLIKWCNKNKYNVHYFNDFTYCACGKGNAKTVEVLIMNY